MYVFLMIRTTSDNTSVRPEMCSMLLFVASRKGLPVGAASVMYSFVTATMTLLCIYKVIRYVKRKRALVAIAGGKVSTAVEEAVQIVIGVLVQVVTIIVVIVSSSS